jgi:hypothetical protein
MVEEESKSKEAIEVKIISSKTNIDKRLTSAKVIREIHANTKLLWDRSLLLFDKAETPDENLKIMKFMNEVNKSNEITIDKLQYNEVVKVKSNPPENPEIVNRILETKRNEKNET